MNTTFRCYCGQTHMYGTLTRNPAARCGCGRALWQTAYGTLQRPAGRG
jgi:hypothetical protein